MNNTDKKLYSKKGIGIATFLGSPIAASILVRHNYNKLGQKQKGLVALIVGIAVTALIFITSYIVESRFGDNSISRAIPAVYTLITIGLVSFLQGKQLNDFEENGGKYKSNWSAAAVGTLCLIPIIGLLFAFSYSNYPITDYDKKMQKFADNEMAALSINSKLNYMGNLSLINEINTKTIPLWEENIRILDTIENSVKINTELKKRNDQLKNYCRLRLKKINTIKLGITQNTSMFNESITKLDQEINELLNEIK